MCRAGILIDLKAAVTIDPVAGDITIDFAGSSARAAAASTS